MKKWPKNGSSFGHKLITFSAKQAVKKHGLYFGIIWLGNCFGCFSKKLGDFFQMIRTD
jgi:hypothetical protein